MSGAVEHSSRGHALLSASSAHRWMTCTPSALLEASMPPSEGSTAAAEGTLAHEICEIKVQNYFYPEKMPKAAARKDIERLKKNELYDPEMDGYTDEYLQYIREVAIGCGAGVHVIIEKRVDFSHVVPEGFGTCDCIVIGGDTMHVIDFKYGKGVQVSAEDNPQLTLYAIGAFKAYAFIYPVKNVVLHIVQPRVNNTNSWTMTTEALAEKAMYIAQRAQLAAEGAGDYCPSESACRFCRARRQCRARSEHNVQVAFGGLGKLPPLITNEELAAYIQQGEDVAAWLADLKEYALSACLRGEEVPGYKAVEGRGRRVWTDEGEAFRAIIESGFEEEMLYERVALSLAKCEKLLGKKAFAGICEEFVEKKPGPPALVKASDKRPAVTLKTTAAEAFAGMNE